MLRYAISDRALFAGSHEAQLAAVVHQAHLLAGEGVSFFQIREKDLAPGELVALTCAVRDAVAGSNMRVVLNGPLALAEKAGVGWHRASTIAAEGEAVSVSCHTFAEVEAASSCASLALFGPVFAKFVQDVQVVPGVGLEALRTAAAVARVPLLALGGVTEQNAAACVAAGAAGFASIRAFLRPRGQHTAV